jgi:hypothetical protein
MWLLLGLVFFALSVGLHALVSRARSRSNRVVSYAVVAFAAGLGLAWVAFGRHGTDVQTWAALVLYALTAELYVFLFTMIGSSITARIVITLRTRDMTLNEINLVFPSSGMVDQRIDNLIRNGFIHAEGPSAYTLTPRGRLIVMGFRPVRSFFRRAQPT